MVTVSRTVDEVNLSTPTPTASAGLDGDGIPDGNGIAAGPTRMTDGASIAATARGAAEGAMS